MYIISILWIIAGIISIRESVKNAEKRKHKNTMIFVSILSIITGLIGVVATINENIKLLLISIVVGCLIWVLYATIRVIRMHLSCKEKVNAVCVRYNSYKSRSQVSYAPVFKYEYNGKEYEQQVPNSFSLKKIQKLYPISEEIQREILINKEAPYECIVHENLKRNIILFTFINILLIAFLVIVSIC